MHVVELRSIDRDWNVVTIKLYFLPVFLGSTVFYELTVNVPLHFLWTTSFRFSGLLHDNILHHFSAEKMSFTFEMEKNVGRITSGVGEIVAREFIARSRVARYYIRTQIAHTGAKQSDMSPSLPSPHPFILLFFPAFSFFPFETIYNGFQSLTIII